MVALPNLFRNVSYVTLKLTNGCNLKCQYCNVEALTPRTPMMSMDRFKQIAQLLIKHSEQPRVGLEFHGGEPMLLSDDWFEEAVGYANDLAAQQGKTVEYPLVTNGTMLTTERLTRLRKLGIRFCMSCDGPPEINDILRAGGSAVERAIKLFQDHSTYVGIITVVSQVNHHRMREIMDWYQTIGVRDFRINFVQPQGRGMDSILLTGPQMFEAIRQIFEHMYESDVSVFEAEVASHIERFVEGRNPNPGLTCWECECQAGRTYVAIDVKGTIHACGTDLKNHVIGHLDQPFDQEGYREKLRVLHDKGDWVLRCFDCDAKRICNHSCPTSDFNSDMYKEHECEYTILMWNYFCKNFDRAKKVHELAAGQRKITDGSFVPVEDIRLAKIS